MSPRFDCSVEGGRQRGIDRAVSAVSAGDLVVLPTDTVYGVGCDAFSPEAVAALLDAKGRGRAMPPPVLIGHVRTLDGIATDVPPQARALVAAFWPGPLTLICRSQPSLQWDLGDTRGTVAVRVPLHPVALELLDRTGPMAVSSANLTGSPAATSCDEAEEQLSDSVTVYLDAGPTTDSVPSTIVDVTGPVPRVRRLGAIGVAELREVVPDLLDERGEGPEPLGGADPDGPDAATPGQVEHGAGSAPEDGPPETATASDETASDETASDETARDETARDETARDGVTSDGAAG